MGNFYRTFAFCVLIFACVHSAIAVASEASKQNVYFAGAATVGAASDAEARFPHISKLIALKEASGQTALDRQLLASIPPTSSINVVTTLGNSASSDATAAALVFTWENTSVKKLSAAYSIVLDLQAELLLFDFATKKVVGAYPFAVQLLDAKSEAPTEEELTQKFSALLYGPDGVVAQFAQALNSVRPGGQSEGVFLKVEVGPSGPDAEAALNQIEIDPSLANGVIGFSFERFLSKNAQVPVIPFVKDQVIGNKMAAKFANADVYNFVLPDPDFVFRLSLKNYRTLVLSESAGSRSLGFAAYLSVDVLQPLSGKTYFSNTFRLPVTATFPKTASDIDQRKWFYEAVFALTDNLTKSLRSDEKGWLVEWAAEKPNKQALAEVRRILEKARH